MSQAGIDLLKQFEGLRLSAYRCSAGVLTIGYGHTGPDVTPKLTISPFDAEQLLKVDLKRFEAAVNTLVKVPLSQNQFDALVSFAYNVGVTALGNSTLLAILNRGDYAGVPAQLARWNKAGGQPSAGLTKRRQVEANLWNGIA